MESETSRSPSFSLEIFSIMVLRLSDRRSNSSLAWKPAERPDRSPATMRALASDTRSMRCKARRADEEPDQETAGRHEGERGNQRLADDFAETLRLAEIAADEDAHAVVDDDHLRQRARRLLRVVDDPDIVAEAGIDERPFGPALVSSTPGWSAMTLPERMRPVLSAIM
jgi:hypothetical protein